MTSDGNHIAIDDTAALHHAESLCFTSSGASMFLPSHAGEDAKVPKARASQTNHSPPPHAGPHSTSSVCASTATSSADAIRISSEMARVAENPSRVTAMMAEDVDELSQATERHIVNELSSNGDERLGSKAELRNPACIAQASLPSFALEKYMSSPSPISSSAEESPGGHEHGTPVRVLSETAKDQTVLDSQMLVSEVPSSSPEDELLSIDVDGAQIVEARIICLAPERANEQTQSDNQAAFDHHGVRSAGSSVADGLFASGEQDTACTPAGFGTLMEIASQAGVEVMSSEPFGLSSPPLVESLLTAVGAENAKDSIYENDLGVGARNSDTPSDAPDDAVFFPSGSAESQAAAVNILDFTESSANGDRHLSSSSETIGPAVGSQLVASEALLPVKSSDTFTSPLQIEDIDSDSWISHPEPEASPITGRNLIITPIRASTQSTSINGATPEKDGPQPLDDSLASGMFEDYIATPKNPEDPKGNMLTGEKVVADSHAFDAQFERIGAFDKVIATHESEREPPSSLIDIIPPTFLPLSPAGEVPLIDAVKDQSYSSSMTQDSMTQDSNPKDMLSHFQDAEALAGDRLEHHPELASIEESVGVTPGLLPECDTTGADQQAIDVSAANNDVLIHAARGDGATTATSHGLTSNIPQIDRGDVASVSETQTPQDAAKVGSVCHGAKAGASEAQAARDVPPPSSNPKPVQITKAMQLPLTSDASGTTTQSPESYPEHTALSDHIAASLATMPSMMPRDDVASLSRLEAVTGQQYPLETDIVHELAVDSASAGGAISPPQPSDPEDPADVRPVSCDVEQVFDDAVDAKDDGQSAGPRFQQRSHPEDMGTKITPRDETVLSSRLSEVNLRDDQTVIAASAPDALAADAMPPTDTPTDEAETEAEIPLAKLAAESGASVVAAASAAPAAVEEPEAPLSDVVTAPANAVTLIPETPSVDTLGKARATSRPAEIPAQPPVLLSQPMHSAPNPNSGEGTWQLKEITWPDPRVGGERRTAKILVQDANGPCSLLALANILILRGSIHITPRSRQVVEYKYLSALIADFLISRPSDASSMSLESALSILPSMTQGLNIDVAFKDIWSFKGTGDAGELAIFQRCGVPLVHGWVADKDSTEFDAVTWAETYDGAQMAIVAGMELQNKENKTPKDISVVKDAHAVNTFISSSATQITYAGLFSLTSSLEQGSIVAFFRNSHLGVLYRRPPPPPSASTDPDDASDALLYQLVTDSSFANEPEVAWESLVDLDGAASAFVNGDFHRSTPGGGEYAGLSAAHAARATARRERGEVQAGTGSEDGDAALARMLQAEEDQQSAQHLSAGEDRSRRSSAANATNGRQRNQSTASNLGYVNIPGGRNGLPSAPNARASMDQGRGEFASSDGRGKATRRPAELLKRQSGSGAGSSKTKDSDEDKKKCLIM